MESAVGIAPDAAEKFLVRLCAAHDTERQIDLALSMTSQGERRKRI